MIATSSSVSNVDSTLSGSDHSYGAKEAVSVVRKRAAMVGKQWGSMIDQLDPLIEGTDQI